MKSVNKNMEYIFVFLKRYCSLKMKMNQLLYLQYLVHIIDVQQILGE